MNLLRNMATVGLFTAISRIFGFVRDILIASFLGAGFAADAFFVAFKFPNLFRRLFAEGAVSAAFVPMFAGKLEVDGIEVARRFADEVFAILLWVLLVFIILVEIFMPYLMVVVAPGFLESPEKFRLTVDLTRITFPYILFISVVSLLGGVLNALGRFSAAAATPIFLNVTLIGAILWLAPFVKSGAYALSWGIMIAGVFQLCWLVWAAFRAGFMLRFVMPRWTEDSGRLVRRILPVAVGAGIYQINLVIDTIIASFLPDGSISYLFYSDRVTQLPLGVIGVAVGTALLPLLARQIKAGDIESAHESQNRAIEFSLIIIFPAAIALAIMSEPIIQTLFERREFSHDITVATARALSVYAWGLPAYILIKSLTPGFFARSDTITPVKISIFCIMLNLCLNLLLMGPLLHVGIALATVIASWFNALLLAIILFKRTHLLIDFEVLLRIFRGFLSAGIMGIVLWLVLETNEKLFDGDEVSRIFNLIFLVALGALIFFPVAHFSKALRIRQIKTMLRDSF